MSMDIMQQKHKFGYDKMGEWPIFPPSQELLCMCICCEAEAPALWLHDGKTGTGGQ